jgi:hypothetical protein
MALNFFLIYLGILFTGSLALWMLIKQFAAAFAAQGKKALIYGIISALLTGGLLFGTTYLTDNLFVVFVAFAAVFLLSGTIHMALMHRKFYHTKEDNFTKLFIGELLFAFCVALMTTLVFSALEYFVRDRAFMFYPVMMSVLFFFVPLLFTHTYRAARKIPAAVFTTWQYPVGKPLDPPDEDEQERLLVIGFEIDKKASDAKKTYFRARAPEGIKLGELFYHFINDYNEQYSETPIQYTDHNNQPYEWWFRIKPKWYQFQRIIDPFYTVKANDIRENSVIICERILKPVTGE